LIHLTAQLRRLLPFVAAFLFFGCGSAPSESDVGSSSQELCSAGSLVSNVGYRGYPSQMVTWTASASCQLANPLFQFWMGDPNGNYTIVQPYSTSKTYTWNTTGLPYGIYSFQVWVKEAGSNKTWETHQGKAFTLTLAPCNSASSTTSPYRTAPQGTTVRITTTAGCLGSSIPEYQVWHQAPGGTYTILQPWGPSAIYDWSTLSEAVGVHGFQVWVRAQGSSASSESHSSFTYTLSAPTACTAPGLVASPASP